MFEIQLFQASKILTFVLSVIASVAGTQSQFAPQISMPQKILDFVFLGDIKSWQKFRKGNIFFSKIFQIYFIQFTVY